MIQFDEKTVSNLIATLESIEVHGTTNMSRLLGCIQVLKNGKSDGQASTQKE